ncbi:MAG: nucleotidyltransferase domain-containing protein [Prochlorotrichaceae cyanobacterium]|jgi:predicted nucleotidyltransferase
MRLKSVEVEQIKTVFHAIFGEGNLYLFGSRVDDTRLGGDIDLFLEIENHDNLFEKKIKFLAKIKRAIGDQKIDVVFNQDPDRAIEKEVRKWRIKL